MGRLTLKLKDLLMLVLTECNQREPYTGPSLAEVYASVGIDQSSCS